jgi:hypothetical protein
MSVRSTCESEPLTKVVTALRFGSGYRDLTGIPYALGICYSALGDCGYGLLLRTDLTCPVMLGRFVLNSGADNDSMLRLGGRELVNWLQRQTMDCKECNKPSLLARPLQCTIVPFTCLHS